MINTCESCVPFVESYANLMGVGPIEAVTNQPGLAWDQVNRLKEIWITRNPESARMDILYTVVHELRHHNGTIFELSTRTISVLSMINYDGSGVGPVIGGLNGVHLGPTNPFGYRGLSFTQVKTPLMEFAEQRFNEYKANSVRPTGALGEYVSVLEQHALSTKSPYSRLVVNPSYDI